MAAEHPHHHDHAHHHARPAAPAFSLLRLGFGERLLGAALLIALLWAAVAWALQA